MRDSSPYDKRRTKLSIDMVLERSLPALNKSGYESAATSNEFSYRHQIYELFEHRPIHVSEVRRIVLPC
jgi:hypothetical protein